MAMTREESKQARVQVHAQIRQLGKALGYRTAKEYSHKRSGEFLRHYEYSYQHASAGVGRVDAHLLVHQYIKPDEVDALLWKILDIDGELKKWSTHRVLGLHAVQPLQVAVSTPRE